MENIECKNCGSTEFKIDSNQVICLYCGTPYLEEERTTETLIVQSKISNKTILGLIFGLALVFLIGLFAFSSLKSQHIVEIQKVSSDSKLSQEEYGYKYIKDAGRWDNKVYDDIKLAKGHIDENGKWIDYQNGTLYRELIQQVGEPSSLHEDEHDNTVTAIWSENPTSHHVLWIHVVYDKQTGLVIRKNVEGWASD